MPPPRWISTTARARSGCSRRLTADAVSARISATRMRSSRRAGGQVVRSAEPDRQAGRRVRPARARAGAVAGQPRPQHGAGAAVSGRQEPSRGAGDQRGAAPARSGEPGCPPGRDRLGAAGWRSFEGIGAGAGRPADGAERPENVDVVGRCRTGTRQQRRGPARSCTGARAAAPAARLLRQRRGYEHAAGCEFWFPAMLRHISRLRRGRSTTTRRRRKPVAMPTGAPTRARCLGTRSVRATRPIASLSHGSIPTVRPHRRIRRRRSRRPCSTPAGSRRLIGRSPRRMRIIRADGCSIRHRRRCRRHSVA